MKLPDQSPAPVLVEERDGKIARVSDRDSRLRVEERDFNEWREPILTHVQELLASDFRDGTNHSRVRDRLVALGTLLPGNVADVKERQFRVGYEIERLHGLVMAYRSGGEDMPALNAAVMEDLDQLRGTLVMGFGVLERWADFRRVALDSTMEIGRASAAAVGGVLDEMIARCATGEDAKYFDPEVPVSFTIACKSFSTLQRSLADA